MTITSKRGHLRSVLPRRSRRSAGRRAGLGVVIVVCALLATSVGAYGAAHPKATGSQAQAIEFLPTYSGIVGETLELSATATSGLAVGFHLASTTACTLDGTTLAFVDVGECDVTAAQPGDGTYSAADDVTRTITSALGYEASWAIETPDGSTRTPGTIKVGDQLSISLAASDATPMTGCNVSFTSWGGWLMESSGVVRDGDCQLLVTLPDFNYPSATTGISRRSLDLCVSIWSTGFSDHQTREMVAADRRAPGGIACYNGSDVTGREDRVLDFEVIAGGNPQPFVSDPPMVSWNPADWSAFVAPRFGHTMHFELPAGFTSCSFYLNGAETQLQPAAPAGCVAWDVRLPGVLPSTMPWPGGPGDWSASIVVNYGSAKGNGTAQTADLPVPYQASDGVFRSNQPAIFPTDLATTRFVTIGDRWRPEFQVSGTTPNDCTLTLYTVPPTFPADPVTSQVYPATTIDPNGKCQFDLPAMTGFHQFYVEANTPDGTVTFGGNITPIAASQPPDIATPTGGQDGTTLDVTPGSGQGLLMDLLVAVDVAGLAGHPVTKHRAADAADSCTARAISSDLDVGGQIPPISTSCALPPGTYSATARMYDAAGKVTTATRTFVVQPPDTIPPDTTITAGPSGSVASSSATFSFSATEAGSTFQCALDAAAFSACVSPKSYSQLGQGSHIFAVRATDLATNLDPTPASRVWTVATAMRQPDGRIRAGTGAYVGDNVYNATGAGQQRSGSTAGGHTVTFGISVQNDGTVTDTFTVKATGITVSGYHVKYFHGTRDITAAVVAGTYRTASLAPGARYLITATVTIKSAATAGSRLTRRVTLTSAGKNAKQDTVRFVAKLA